MNIKKVSIAAIISILFLSCTIGDMALALAKEVKIATISLQDILAKSSVGEDAKNKLEAKVVEFQAELQKEQEKQDALRTEIEKKSSVWSDGVRQEKERDYQKMVREFQIKSEDAKFELQQMEKKIMAPILKELHEIIAEVGKKNGYTLIFENTKKGLESRSGLLYADDALDISDLVREALEKRLAEKKKSP